MKALGLVRFTARSLARRPVRTFLTILGLAALILTYVSVQSLVSTLEVNVSGTVSSLGGEVDVWSKGAVYPLVSKIPENYTRTVASVAGVSLAAAVDVAQLTVGQNQALVAGVIPRQIPSLLNYTMITGEMIASNQSGTLVVGKLLAATLGTSSGATVQLDGMPYQISGVFETNTWMDYSVIIPHSVAQQMIGMEGGTSMIVVIVKDPRNIDWVVSQIRAALPAVDAFRTGEAPSRISPIFGSLETIATDITGIVTFGAVLGITNSNLNSLRERMRTFAIFKATGAAYGQIVRIILYESLILGGLGTLLGLGVSYLVLRLISVPIVQSFSVSVYLAPLIFFYAGLIGISVTLVAAIYPALRTAKVRPKEVFRFG